MSERTITTGGIALHVRIDGPEDAPWLVFANSLMTDLRLWDQQVERLAGKYRILRYDQRGHGQSAVPPTDCDFATLADDLATIMTQCGVGWATIVGVSMGGVTALALMERHPHLVARAAICDCGPASNPAGAAAWEERIAVAAEGGMLALVQPTIARWFTPATVQQEAPCLALVRQMIAETAMQGFVRAARALQSYDLRPGLDRIRVPVALIVGADDAALPDVMRGMARQIASASLTVIPECGHLPNLEQPAAFAAALSRVADI